MSLVLPTYADVVSAAATLKGIAHRTPVVTSATADRATRARLFFKCENLQRMGAFKFRGAFNAISNLTADERRAGVLTFSSGNHAQAIALAGKLLGVKTTIIMPLDATAASFLQFLGVLARSHAGIAAALQHFGEARRL